MDGEGPKVFSPSGHARRDGGSGEPASPVPIDVEDLLPAVARAYADVLRRQGRTTTPFVRWAKTTSRAHDFAWLGSAEAREVLMRGRGPLQIRRDNPLFEVVQKMHATATLNPYEREVLYGYPYVIGRRDGETIRGPLLTLAVRIEAEGEGFLVHAADDVVHVNALPFKAEGDLTLHEQKVRRLVDTTPGLPLEATSLTHFVDTLIREFAGVRRADVTLDGRLATAPPEPRGDGDHGLWLVDQAALFIAPKTSYFLASDLDHIGAMERTVQASALHSLLSGPGDEAQVDLDDALTCDHM